jgi:Zinc dependent phospholipase C
MNLRRLITAFMAVALLLIAQPLTEYSVFTHEELIDLAWSSSIRPLLLARFPGSTDAQLRVAHSYAYGGCAIQDMGYYPFAKQFFSNLTHYVRAGDFVSNLLNDARTRDEYAFAIGALSHYLGDSIGHSQAINLATPVAFPKLEREYGPRVTYDEDPDAHVRTEWAFDINQLSKRTFAPPSYMRHIGFRVPRRLLDHIWFRFSRACRQGTARPQELSQLRSHFHPGIFGSGDRPPSAPISGGHPRRRVSHLFATSRASRLRTPLETGIQRPGIRLARAGNRGESSSKGRSALAAGHQNPDAHDGG